MQSKSWYQQSALCVVAEILSAAKKVDENRAKQKLEKEKTK